MKILDLVFGLAFFLMAVGIGLGYEVSTFSVFFAYITASMLWFGKAFSGDVE